MWEYEKRNKRMTQYSGVIALHGFIIVLDIISNTLAKLNDWNIGKYRNAFPFKHALKHQVKITNNVNWLLFIEQQ